ncbi:hypothetical protein GGR50DRAFT_686356 [Xylaria sp. CBS 124048]|nr:hypothetical protein GGR50DRAFT_686356 [Xylaria sp. CBS 124048]
MTEKFPPLLTHSSTPSHTVAPSPRSAAAISNYVPSKTTVPVEEEPYTIKCICDFLEDDGNTIYCDVCDTWQHIECYYPDKMVEVAREDFNHSCVDCKPRDVNRRQAKERQRLRQISGHHIPAPERKTATTTAITTTAKRPPHKSQKKKARPADLGYHGHSSSGYNSKHSHDFVPTAHQHKRSKSSHRPSQAVSSHRPSQSVSSQVAKRSPSFSQKTTNPHVQPPSPSTTPRDPPHESEIHNYSSGFMNLYKEDRDIAIVQTNSFASLTISNRLSVWLRDGDKLRQETGCDFGDVFRSLPPGIDSIKALPKVVSKKKTVGSNIAHWQYLASARAVDKDVPLVELNGQIGIQKDYCEDPRNRWQGLSSPLPFVFFHPMLPLYIDTRKEGSRARYVRRSCKPNATLDTFLSDGSEYHFWLVSDRFIDVNEQITISWDFNLQKDVAKRWLQLLGLSDDVDKQPAFNEKETETYQSIAAWVHTVLSEYGGCACDLGPDCAFSRFHRTYITRLQSKDKGSKQRGQRKAKANDVSPTSTDQARNSRAPSEGRADDNVDVDSGSSSLSKPPSRDLTPTPRQGSFDTLGVLTELTDRDKRKVQMVEDSFRRMEQQAPPRKKKRLSDGTTVSNHPTASGVAERRYVDASTCSSVRNSPTSAEESPAPAGPSKQPNEKHSDLMPARRSSVHSRPQYIDASVQTDPPPKRKRRVIPLAKRLLENRHRLQADDDSRRRSIATSPNSVTTALVGMGLESPVKAQRDTPTPASEMATRATIRSDPFPAPASTSEDTPMPDAPAPPADATKVPAVKESATPADVKVKSQELRVQPPPVPAFNSSPVVNSSGTTPVSASSSVQSPQPQSASNINSPSVSLPVSGAPVPPNPVKKKLTLSDYTKSRMNKVAAAAAKSNQQPNTMVEGTKPPVADTVVPESAIKDKQP